MTFSEIFTIARFGLLSFVCSCSEKEALQNPSNIAFCCFCSVVASNFQNNTNGYCPRVENCPGIQVLRVSVFPNSRIDNGNIKNTIAWNQKDTQKIQHKVQGKETMFFFLVVFFSVLKLNRFLFCINVLSVLRRHFVCCPCLIRTGDVPLSSLRGSDNKGQ